MESDIADSHVCNSVMMVRWGQSVLKLTRQAHRGIAGAASQPLIAHGVRSVAQTQTAGRFTRCTSLHKGSSRTIGSCNAHDHMLLSIPTVSYR